MERYGEEKQTFTDILRDPRKGIDQSCNLLAMFYRQILFERDIGIKRFEYVLKTYLHSPHSGIPDNNTARQNHRGNLMKELANPNMTWNVFVKGLRVLGIQEMQLRFYLKDINGVTTKHVRNVENFPPYKDPVLEVPSKYQVSGFPDIEGTGEPAFQPTESHETKQDIVDVMPGDPAETNPFRDAIARIKQHVKDRG